MPNTPRARDSHGRFKANHRTRNLALGVGAAFVATGAAIGTALWRGWVRMPQGPWAEGDAAPDLALDAPPASTNRAPDAFRPDGDAPVPAGDREALRPPAGVSTGFSEDRGSAPFIAAR